MTVRDARPGTGSEIELAVAYASGEGGPLVSGVDDHGAVSVVAVVEGNPPVPSFRSPASTQLLPPPLLNLPLTRQAIPASSSRVRSWGGTHDHPSGFAVAFSNATDFSGVKDSVCK